MQGHRTHPTLKGFAANRRTGGERASPDACRLPRSGHVFRTRTPHGVLALPPLGSRRLPDQHRSLWTVGCGLRDGPSSHGKARDGCERWEREQGIDGDDRDRWRPAERAVRAGVVARRRAARAAAASTAGGLSRTDQAIAIPDLASMRATSRSACWPPSRTPRALWPELVTSRSGQVLRSAQLALARKQQAVADGAVWHPVDEHRLRADGVARRLH